MALHNIMYNGMSGLNSMSGNMAVLGDNIANVNTVSYKAAQTTFQSVLTSSQARFGEIGNGSQIAAISKNFLPGQFEATSKSTDMAIAGQGFFMLRDPREGETLYGRDGQFNLEILSGTPAGSYNLVTPDGRYVQGINLGSVANPNGNIEDILIRRQSLPQATANVNLAVNLENAPASEAVNPPLYAAWDGAVVPPLAADQYAYRTTIQAFDDQGQNFDLVVYFDRTASANEWEFMVTHDPALDRRLIDDNGTRYNDGDSPERGAGILLYGRLLFNRNGEMLDIQAWNVPPTSELVPEQDNQLAADPQSGLYSFAYNLSGTGANLNATIDFGTTLAARQATSPGGARADATGVEGPAISAMTLWESVYDRHGNRIQEGDQFTFSGLTGAGQEVELIYKVEYGQRVEDLLLRLENAFNCTALVRNGQLELHDLNPGESQLTVTGITYRDAAGNSPAENPDLARPFGEDGVAFLVEEGDGFELNPIRTTNYAVASATIAQGQDGFGAGVLQNISVKADGTIVAYYSNNQQFEQARVMLADFANYRGLDLASGNAYRATAEAGAVVVGAAGSGSFGKVMGNSLETSNVDLGRQFVDLMMTQRIFQANSKSITTADEIFDTLMRIK
ncbi:MAG TPA: flagellar hook-basal body complex protein [Desulfurivibrio alkaliphilus]|uniref:Flagellar hook protein FlgE n=1 Tax=Desulfurivibrio alkaliphilus TaxID=427923 RepID=A0A7C2X9Q9_9BACT|nr:flagellar hook-basal body complex protein [Desulfurivibrio alkaliphilus]